MKLTKCHKVQVTCLEEKSVECGTKLVNFIKLFDTNSMTGMA